MRKLLAILALGATVMACSDQATSPQGKGPAVAPRASLAATSDWTEVLLNLPAGDGAFYADCTDDFLDEVGPALLRYHTVATENGTLLSFQLRTLDGYHLVGVKTGIWNPVPPQQGVLTERIPGAVGSYTFHYSLTQGFQNVASGTRIYWPTQTKVTVNANGTVTVEREKFEACHIVGQH